MDINELISTTRTLIAGDKGLLAMDESTATCNKRFAKLGIPETVDFRRAWRELIVTTPRLGDCISGAILYDETIRQQTQAGVPFIDVLVGAGIIPGIKVDLGAKPLAGSPGETVTEGLDGLRDRLTEYRQMGARFAKWRAVITIADSGNERLPTPACVEANVHALARYAALCQEVGLVPIVEPEVLMEGSHTLERCGAVTQAVLENLFVQLSVQGVALEGMLLKPNMVLAGIDSPQQLGVDEVADATVTCLLRSVPAAVPGIAFLSGGQSPDQASSHLNAIHRTDGPTRFNGRMPWAVTFSFSRAIQQPAMDLWKGQDANVEAAQQELLNRAMANCAARRGQYTASNSHDGKLGSPTTEDN
ncbi:class I fructose-bisphosphate aldolase [Spirosoma arcticum]